MQFIYTMKGLGKIYPPDSQVLKEELDRSIGSGAATIHTAEIV